MTGPTVRAALLAALLALGACGEADVTTPVVPSATASPIAPTSAPAVTSPDDLPGEPFDIVPSTGSEVAAVGVAHDDLLNVRAGPGVDFDVVATIAATGLAVSLGDGRLLDSSIWLLVDVDGTPGWVNSSFIGQLGATDDLTARVVQQLGERPAAADVQALGLVVAQALASREPPSRITMTIGPSTGDLDEVTYDVVGLADDSVLGLRVHVFGRNENGEVGLGSVEATILCGRGVTDDGLCI